VWQAAAGPRPAPDLVELRIRIDALANDIDKAIRSLNPHQSRTQHRCLIDYGANKFRALARRLDANPSPRTERRN
jgi:hypothetical protein